MAVPEFGKAIPHFLSNVLSTPAGALPKGAQWVVIFEDLQGILPAIKLALKYEGRTSTDWNVPEEALNKVLSPGFQQEVGCVFCHAIDMPGDSLVVNPEGNIMSNAFLRSYVGQGRNQFPQLRMTFLNTNLSFTENFLRPWVLATGHFGLIARTKQNDSEKNYRTNAHLYKLGTFKEEDPPYILTKMSFYDICCVSVADEEHNYNVATSPMYREAQFIYNYYSINSAEAGPMFDIVNSNLNTPASELANQQLQEIKAKYNQESIQTENSYDKKFAEETLASYQAREEFQQRSELSKGQNSYNKKFTMETLSSYQAREEFQQRSRLSNEKTSYDKKFAEETLLAFQAQQNIKNRSIIVNTGEFYLKENPYYDPFTDLSLNFLEYEKLAKDYSLVPSDLINPLAPYFDFKLENYLPLQSYQKLPIQRSKNPNSIYPPKDLPFFEPFSSIVQTTNLEFVSFNDYQSLPKTQIKTNQKRFESQQRENEITSLAQQVSISPISVLKTAYDKANQTVTDAKLLTKPNQKALNEFKEKANKIYGETQAKQLIAKFQDNLLQRQFNVVV